MPVNDKWRLTPQEIENAPSIVPGRNWSPLDNVAPPEYVPEEWSGPHVGYRLVQAFRTLGALPMRRGVGGALGFWPQIFQDEEDEAEYRATWDDMSPSDRRELQERFYTEKITAQDISRMETAIAWPGTFLADRPDLSRTVQRVAFYRSMDMSNRDVAQKMKRDAKDIRRDNREGLDLIAVGLRRIQFPVF